MKTIRHRNREYIKSYYPILFKYNCLRRKREVTKMILLVSFSVTMIIIVGIGLFDVFMTTIIQLIKNYLNI